MHHVLEKKRGGINLANSKNLKTYRQELEFGQKTKKHRVFVFFGSSDMENQKTHCFLVFLVFPDYGELACPASHSLKKPKKTQKQKKAMSFLVFHI